VETLATFKSSRKNWSSCFTVFLGEKSVPLKKDHLHLESAEPPKRTPVVSPALTFLSKPNFFKLNYLVLLLPKFFQQMRAQKKSTDGLQWAKPQSLN